VTATDEAAEVAIKCKRIIDGKTYNTETATQIAGSEGGDGPYARGRYLYQTRFGAFFLYSYREGGGEDDYENIEPFTPEEARGWLEKNESYRVDVIESLFGQMPEAGSGESKFTLRMPDSLRDRLAELAKANDQSLNAWIVRCLEYCAAEALAHAAAKALSDAGSGNQRDIPPMRNMVGSNRTGWRTRGT
jgi:predicted transcriptional regulator